MHRKASTATLPGFRDITQVAVITRDTRQVILDLVRALGAGSFKFVTLKPPALFDTVYDGRPGDGSMRVGLTWIGDMQLEVIEPLAERNVYAEYLARRGGRSGVEHVFLQHDGITYDDAVHVFDRAGYAPRHLSRLNASGRLGILPVPPLPGFLAPKLATRFCYTSTHDSLKIDVELARFAFGVSARLGLRIAVADEWIPAEAPRHFESLPADAVIDAIDGVYVLAADLDALADAYGRLTDRRPAIARFSDAALPGEGRVAHISLASTAIFLAEPHSGPLRELLEENGEGVQMLRVRAAKGDAALRARGWAVERSAGGLFARHAAVPFALWANADEHRA